MGGSSSPDQPAPISAGQNFGEAINVLLERGGELRNLAFLDQLGQIEQLRRLAPALANVNLDFESQFGPALRAQASEAQRQTRAGDIYNVASLSPGIRQAEAIADPMSAQIRNTLGQQTISELNAGASLDPGLRREVEQAIRGAQTARGITRGSAPVAAEAFSIGSRGEQLRRNRQQAASNFLGLQQSTQVNPFAFVAGQPVQQAQPQSLGQGQTLNSLPGLIGATTDANNMNSQLAFNASQVGGGNGMVGALGGAAAGAYVGSTIPVVGTAIGAGVGGLLGYFGSR